MDDRLDIIRGRIIEERGARGANPLADYTRLFPGEDALVARAYADVYGVAASPATANQDALGHYRIVKELGRGGQGVVYLAEDTRLHRKVALKVLTGLGPGSEDSVHRLRREAEVASRLEHPGICGVHDAGVANGTPYIAMHYVEGETLAERISATRGHATEDEESSMVLLTEMTETGADVERKIPPPTATTMTPKGEIPEILASSRRPPPPFTRPTKPASSTATSSRATSWSRLTGSPSSSTSDSRAPRTWCSRR